MKKFIFGFLAGCFITFFAIVTFFETVHIEVEKSSMKYMCGFLFDATGEIYGEKLQNYLYITYKVFSKPIKSILISGVPENVKIIKN